jgi:hypothetical protein
MVFTKERFEREMGNRSGCCWLLPNATDHHWKQTFQLVTVLVIYAFGLTWRVESPRVIALMRTSDREFRFGLDEVQRHRSMKRFDLYMQRGGG